MGSRSSDVPQGVVMAFPARTISLMSAETSGLRVRHLRVRGGPIPVRLDLAKERDEN